MRYKSVQEKSRESKDLLWGKVTLLYIGIKPQLPFYNYDKDHQVIGFIFS